MSDKTEMDRLARQYMDLWQQQLAGLASDPEVAGMVARTLEMMTAGAALFATAAGGESHAEKEVPGAAPAAPARGGAHPDLDGLARRLAALEERVAHLEAGTGGSRRKPAPKAGKPRR